MCLCEREDQQILQHEDHFTHRNMFKHTKYNTLILFTVTLLGASVQLRYLTSQSQGSRIMKGDEEEPLRFK